MTKATHLFLSLPILVAVASSIDASEKSPDARRAAMPYATVPAASFQQNRNAISGLITDTSNRPLNRIRVELLDDVEMSVTQTYTDSVGRYSFRNLSQGTFIVKVHTDGVHLGQSVRVSLYQARSGGGGHYEQLDIVLKTRDDVKGPAIPANTGPAFVQDVPDAARKVYERAVKQLENSKQTEQGVASLKEAISLFPDYYLALERLGVEHVKRQQYEEARSILSKAKEVNPNGASCLYVLGVAQFNLRQFPEAVESLNRSLLLASESPNAALTHFYLGLALWKAGKDGDAEAHLKKSYELGGNIIPADVHMHLAQFYSNNKRYKEAADELELFLKQTPDARDAEKIKNLIKQLRAKAKSAAPSSK
jgi:Tfp pilus assembly protein PilF